MKYTEYEKALSPARLKKYTAACNGNQDRGLTLYRRNMKLCQKLYGMLSVFEVIIRNAIDQHYKVLLNDADWMRNNLGKGGMMEYSPHLKPTSDKLNELLLKDVYTHDRLVSSVSFGFWTYLFTKIPYTRGGKSLLRIFPNKVKGLGQKEIYNELLDIKRFRNRIAHHEPVCFDVLPDSTIDKILNLKK